MSRLPALPDGWVQQYDQKTEHPFWVDTKAKPPRATWVHPYEDEQFLNEHPDIRDRIAAAAQQKGSASGAPPPYSPRRHSFSGQSRPQSGANLTVDSSGSAGRATSQPPSPGADGRSQNRNFFGKIKDKTIGTKEEREEARRQSQIAEQERDARMQQLGQQRQRGWMDSTSPYGNGPYGQQYGQGYGQGYGQQYGQPYGQQYGQPYGQTMYGAPSGDPFAISGGRYHRGHRFGGFGGGGYGGGGFGGGGMAMPLLGGLAGGLLLGDVLDDFGGGGFGGGWGGGGFF